MNFYELIFIVRPDLSSSELDKLMANFLEIIERHSGKVIANEYWGLKNLAYKIGNNKKGHYAFLGVQMTKECKEEVENKIKLGGIEISSQIIRHMVLRVEEINKTPPQMFKSSNAEVSAINVTI